MADAAREIQPQQSSRPQTPPSPTEVTTPDTWTMGILGSKMAICGVLRLHLITDVDQKNNDDLDVVDTSLWSRWVSLFYVFWRIYVHGAISSRACDNRRQLPSLLFIPPALLHPNQILLCSASVELMYIGLPTMLKRFNERLPDCLRHSPR
jgi:hypothetical protein